MTELKRHWEDLSHLSNAAPPVNGGRPKWPFDFSVMSYNILSQDLLCDNTYLYRHCHPPILDWHHRYPNIIKELERHSADVSEWNICEWIAEQRLFYVSYLSVMFSGPEWMISLNICNNIFSIDNMPAGGARGPLYGTNQTLARIFRYFTSLMSLWMFSFV